MARILAFAPGYFPFLLQIPVKEKGAFFWYFVSANFWVDFTLVLLVEGESEV